MSPSASDSHNCYLSSCFPGVSVVKNLPAMQKSRVRSLCREDPLEKEVTTHSGILGCWIPWTEEAGRLQSVRWRKLDMTEHACIFPLLGSWPSRFWSMTIPQFGCDNLSTSGDRRPWAPELVQHLEREKKLHSFCHEPFTETALPSIMNMALC